MHRSVERRCFSVPTAVPGTVVVGPFTHPNRGPVRCSGSPFVTGGMRQLGYEVVETSQHVTPCTGPADGVLVSATYLDRTGRAIGFGITVHASDRTAIAAAHHVVATWSGIWRTRRVMIAGTTSSCDTASALFGFPCGHEASTSADLARFVADDGDVVVVGGMELNGHTTITSVQDVATLDVDPARVCYVVSPGTVIEQAAPVIRALRARFPGIRGQHPDGFCYATSDRAESARAVAAVCDTMFVLGPQNSTATSELAGLARSTGKPVHVVDDLARIRPEHLIGVESIGIAVSASAPTQLCKAVVSALSGLGPMSLLLRRVSTETLPLDAVLPADACEIPVQSPHDAGTLTTPPKAELLTERHVITSCR
jgi:4-hydroxy-3-methylbut-2-enyl diphosphate reductase